MSNTDYLNQFLDSFTEVLSPEVAQRIIDLRASSAVESRAAQLATKANLGALSAAEDAEYKCLVEALDIVGILQAKARKYLEWNSS